MKSVTVTLLSLALLAAPAVSNAQVLRDLPGKAASEAKKQQPQPAQQPSAQGKQAQDAAAAQGQAKGQGKGQGKKKGYYGKAMHKKKSEHH